MRPDVRACDILIIGAGIYGLSCAWNIAKHDTGAEILVVDAGEFASGASGRNGSGFRMQWGLELNIRLCQESIRFFEEIESHLEYPDGIELHQSGYLLLASNEKELQRLNDAQALQHRFGVPSESMTPEDCMKMVPSLNPAGIAGGAFCGKDGVANPFKYLDALQKAATRLGVEIQYSTCIDALRPEGDRYAARGAFGEICAHKVLICTDWAASELLEEHGAALPITGLPKEALVSQPCAPCVAPMVVSLKHHIALAQTARGSIVFTVTRHRDPGGDISSQPDFLKFAGRQLQDLTPGLSHLKILRTWGGSSSVTPDMQGVYGETALPGVFVAVSSYRGFMTGPAAGRVMSEIVLNGQSNDPVAAELNPFRFSTGELVYEPLLNQD
ncbi:MAG: FAD-binding oxidoreductase [Sedimentitalea sp.]|uniref:NAD(P)/FAD-dependent oxidoreductase n=1 Tax=Sedimentitalea sp. TaxID=2048915 RepID=UPI00326788B7